MADKKLNPAPKNNKPPETTAPPGISDPPALEPIKGPSNLSGHEQVVIHGTGEDAPAHAGKVIDLSSIQVTADLDGKEPIAPDVAAKPTEAASNQKCRGRPSKAKPEAGTGKPEKGPHKPPG